MGVPFRIVLYASNSLQASEAARAAFARVAELNGVMSDYDPDSELSRLSRSSETGLDIPLSSDLWLVLARAQSLAKRTGGAFDVTVGPYVHLWRKARRDQQLPRPDLLEAAGARVGYEHLELDPNRRTARLMVPDMRLDLGGIAKGYAVDAALAILREKGCGRALVSGGGDLAVGDAPPARAGWRIELAPLDLPDAPPARFLLLTRMALATSGDVFQHLEFAQVRYSHIIDPRTGLAMTDHSLVSVLAPDCMTADGLATAVTVLGPRRGLNLVRETPQAEAFVARAPEGRLETLETPGFRRYLTQGVRSSD